MQPIPASVLVIENHPLMREALCAAISDESDLKIGMQAASGADVLKMLAIILPDIIVFGLGNPGQDELKTLSSLCESLPGIPILTLTSNEVSGQDQAALNAGAQVVLTKAASRDEILAALRKVHRKNYSNQLRILDQEVRENSSP